ncbi:hypothetical protein F444_05428 [Phytophthora nicotianae P1976]|uniref:Uncharacterized protein n=1 Tax=Phytophthora nicotianae P1976 TaxID=1317066 RepID=A0A081AM13_PHYNI|nr:hypothetical protein F444_05428 [Phytophthora nicotianae P1976]
MVGLRANGHAPCNKINWLKSLLDEDEDSSDATPQQKKDQRLEKFSSADKQLMKKKVHKGKSATTGDDAIQDRREGRQESNNKKNRPGRYGTDREGELGSRSSDSVVKHQHDSQDRNHLGKTPLSVMKNEAGEKRSRKNVEEKGGKIPQRKRLHAGLEIEVVNEKKKVEGLQQKCLIDPAKAKAAALRQRRMRKLRARRKATGEHKRLAAAKLKRQESSEASRLKRIQREQMRKAQKAPGAAGIYEEGEREVNARPCSAPLSTEDAKEQKRLLEPLHRAANKQLGGLKSSAISALKRPRTAGVDKERLQRKEDAHHALGKLDNKAGLRRKRQRLELVKQEAESAAGTGLTLGSLTSPNKKSESRDADAMHSKDAAVFEIPHEQEAPSTRDSTNVDGPESQEPPTQYVESCRDITIREEVKEEGQVDPPASPRSISADVRPQDESEKTNTNDMNGMDLDMAPIPRKSIKDASSAASFVIPKRSVINSDGQVKCRAVYRNDRKPVGRIPISVRPEPSPASSPLLSSRDPIRSQRKRTKAHVPIKNSALSAHDKALMRLARKRNSIIIAAGELAVQPSLVGSKTSAARMTGYEVFDADGKVLPDLVSRWNSATKSEMIANKGSFPASFFGVSLAAPKAIGTVNGCADVESRMMNCYEELRFQRPEDRDFYQRRMYGTAFVPQHLRGRTTLIVRCARFERKSTGIRFNQDRDREEFAASLSKRYTYKKSVPRCEIRRENWQKLMQNQPGVVYLHYSNIEDAERASYVFRDDAGNALELKHEHKSCVGDGRDVSPTNGNGSYRTPIRSFSNERSPSKSSSQPPQGGTVRNTQHWHRERQEATNRYSRYDQPPSIGRESDRFNLSVSGYSRFRSRSRSRSRLRRFPDQQHKSVEKGNGGETTGAVGTSLSLSSEKSAGELVLESGEEEQEEGEIENNTQPVLGTSDRIEGREGRRCSRSPRARWEQPQDVQSYQRQEDYRRRPYDQNYDRGPKRRRSRSRSRPRPEDCAPWEGGEHGDSWNTKERCYRDYGPVEVHHNSEYGRLVYSGEASRYRGRDYRGGGYNDRTGDAYMRSY